MAGFSEVADRVWVARYPWLDVNVSMVAGDAGLLVLDTQASAELAREVVADLRRVSAQPVLYAVNSHEHWDHTFGNGVLQAEGAELVCHETTAETLPEHAADVRRQAAEEDDPRYAAVAATEIVVPERTFSSAISLDLGDRLVELAHPGRGHTAGDLVVRVPDADVVVAGDLLEESGAPVYGEDSYPLDWPTTIDVVLGMLTPASVVVPGHGRRVDRAWVEQQRNDLAWVTSNIRELAGRGVPVAEAATATEWPWPTDGWRFAGAIERGYAQLPPAARGLPLA